MEQVKEKSPLVHNITNYVTVNDVANVILAAGASPIMADEPAEAADITAICNGLNINIGTLNRQTIEAMHIQELTHGSQELPILMMADTFNRVVWFQQGYTIGIVDQIMSVIRQLMINEK